MEEELERQADWQWLEDIDRRWEEEQESIRCQELERASIEAHIKLIGTNDHDE